MAQTIRLAKVDGRVICDGHMAAGRLAKYLVLAGKVQKLAICDACLVTLSVAIELNDLNPPADLGTFDPNSVGEGKGPDFRPLPTIPPVVKP